MLTMVMLFMRNRPINHSQTKLNATLAITGAIKICTLDKLNHELGLEYFQQRRWIRWLYLLYKLFSTRQLAHVNNLLVPMRNSHKHFNTFPVFPCRTKHFFSLNTIFRTTYYFFPHVINKSNKLDPNTHSSDNSNIFCNALWKIKRPVESKILNINDPCGMKCYKFLDLVLFTFVSSNLDTVLKTHSIHFVPVVSKLKLQQHSISCPITSIIQTRLPLSPSVWLVIVI